MGKRFSPTLVGAFVLGAVLLAIIALVVLGSGHFFTGKTSYVLYFDRDVNGLRVGAPVKFRGVDIGTVDAVLLSLNGLEQPSKNGPDVEIPVVINIDSRKIESHGAEDDLSDPIVMKHAVALGLRGQLAMQSFVTGVLYVDLDMHPGTNARFSMNTLERQERYEGIQEIPTLPTALEQAQETLAKVIEELGNADLPGLIHSFSDTAHNINTFIQSPGLKNSVDQLGIAAKNLSEASASITVVANKLDSEIGPLGDSLTKSSRQAGEALHQAQLTLAGVQHTLEPESPLNYQLTQTLQDLSSAAVSVHELADMLQRNPSVLVRGRFVGTQQR